MTLRRLITCLMLPISFSLLAGCVDLPKKAPIDRTNYMLKAIPDASAQQPVKAIVMLNNATIVPQYASSYFIYQTGPSTYKTDYYHKFFVSPSLMITQIMQDWLSKTFTQIIPNTSMILPDYIIQPNITELYANTKTSEAFMSVDVMLLKRSSISQKLVYQQSFSAKNSFTLNQQSSLINAWNQDLTKILMEMSKSLSVTINTAQSPIY